MTIAGIEVYTASVTTTTTTTGGGTSGGGGYVSIIGEQPHGCYKDAGKRDLENRLKTAEPKECFELAVKAGYKYAGLQYGGECWAGNKVGNYGKRPDGECNMNCKKDPSRKCGAGWRNSVFTMPAPPEGTGATGEKHQLIFGKVHQQTQEVGTSDHRMGLPYLGCFVDRNQRDLTPINWNTSPTECFKAAREKGFEFASM